MLRRSIKYFLPDAVPVYHHYTDPNVKNMKKLVLIAGWGGSTRKHLKKVINYYNNEGYGVISLTMPLIIPGFVRTSIENMLAEEINLKLAIQTEEKKSSGLITHLFSNNGAWTYASLMKRRLVPNSELVIWDSSPAIWKEKLPVLPMASAYSKVLLSIFFGKPIYYHPIMSPIITGITAAVFSIADLIIAIQGNLNLITDTTSLNKFLYDESPIVPTIFIYSSGDTLIPPEVVKSFIDYLHSRGVPVASKLFGDEVPHTSSFYLKRNDYVEYLETFLKSDKVDMSLFRITHHN